MSVGILLRVTDGANSVAFYRALLADKIDTAIDEIDTTQGPMWILPWKHGGCLFLLQATTAAIDVGIPVVLDGERLALAAEHGARVRRVGEIHEVADVDGNLWWAFDPAVLHETYKTGLGQPILPLIYAIERGELDATWKRAWGHGGRDPVATAWRVSVGYLDELVAALGCTGEAQQACDIYNALSATLEAPFIQERIRQALRAPTLADAERAAAMWAARRAGS